MRSAGAALAAAFFILQPLRANGQTADLTRLTCANVLELRGGEPERLLLWLHGYYAGAAQRARIEPRQIEEAMAAMRAACEANRDLPLIGLDARAIFLSATPSAEAKPRAEPSPSAPPGTAAADTGRPRPLPAR